MINHELNRDVVAEVAAMAFPDASLVGLVPLRGGLEAAVARLTIVGPDRRQRSMVMKRLPSSARREASFYSLVAPLDVTPSLLGTVEHEGATYLFLERIRAVKNWPWRDSANTRLVMELLARVHRLGRETVPADGWDYEHDLQLSAEATLAIAVDRGPEIHELSLARDLRPLRRVCASLAELRERMTAAAGTALIHGDVHTGNVIVRRMAGRDRAVLLDWGRSRTGSPLEDVSSWLLSLRLWEPAAARDHDSLFRAYLSAAGLPAELTPELRDAYWFAAAGNALAGALRYQLLVAAGSGGKRRATAVAHARAALRVIRLADERLQRARRN